MLLSFHSSANIYFHCESSYTFIISFPDDLLRTNSSPDIISSFLLLALNFQFVACFAKRSLHQEKIFPCCNIVIKYQLKELECGLDAQLSEWEEDWLFIDYSCIVVPRFCLLPVTDHHPTPDCCNFLVTLHCVWLYKVIKSLSRDNRITGVNSIAGSNMWFNVSGVPLKPNHFFAPLPLAFACGSYCI